MSPFASRKGALVVPLALLALGCSAELEQYSTDADTGSTHALITVQRSTRADGRAPRADALAGFLRVPAEVESKPLYQLLGLKNPVPAPGQCRARSAQPEATPPLSPMGRVELLPVGEVLLSVSGTETTLAPHAFPTVTESISGVVYTSRDRSAEALPPGMRYVVRATSPDGPAIEVTREAPQELESVTVGGVPMAELTEVSVKDPVDVTWAVGSAGDLVVVELSAADGASALVCSFRDEAGAGTIPAGGLATSGAGRLALHRLRSESFTAVGVDVGELGFDFELGTSVTFTQ